LKKSSVRSEINVCRAANAVDPEGRTVIVVLRNAFEDVLEE
jgi:hypothetical protein